MTVHLGIDDGALAYYLQAEGLTDEDAVLDIVPISGGRSNLTYALTVGGQRAVLRRPPTAGLTESAHDMVREWTVMAGLQQTGVPVARTIALCTDPAVLGAPFTIVGFVDGTVIRSQDDLSAVPDAELPRVIDGLVATLATLHAVEAGSVGLGSFGRPDGFVTRQVSLWWRQWQSVRTRELADVETLHGLLSDRIPVSGPASVIHGDFRIDNTILDRSDLGQVRAVVDWELSTVGDPLTDAALMCAYRHPSFDAIMGQPAAWTSSRLPDRDALAETYSRLSGRELRHWDFYLGLAYFKLAVIGEGIAYRSRSGFDAGGTGALAAEATQDLVAAGLRALRGGL